MGTPGSSTVRRCRKSNSAQRIDPCVNSYRSSCLRHSPQHSRPSVPRRIPVWRANASGIAAIWCVAAGNSRCRVIIHITDRRIAARTTSNTANGQANQLARLTFCNTPPCREPPSGICYSYGCYSRYSWSAVQNNGNGLISYADMSLRRTSIATRFVPTP